MPLGNLGPMALQASGMRSNFLFGMEQLQNQIKQAKLSRLFQLIGQRLEHKQRDKEQDKARQQQLIQSGILAASLGLGALPMGVAGAAGGFMGGMQGTSTSGGFPFGMAG
jgi:hypothetical protein